MPLMIPTEREGFQCERSGVANPVFLRVFQRFGFSLRVRKQVFSAHNPPQTIKPDMTAGY